ncbi:hypothetical protein DZK27_12570 [Rhodobacteraceae bacterium 63075]|nr:hypothetical protein DZK27_12570 [Rhodobacteraceae bacterium 63075]
MKKTTLAVALSMSLASGSAQAADVAPSGSNNDEKVLIGAALIGLAIWLLAGKDGKGSMSTSSKNAESGTGSGKVLQEF